MLKKIKRLYYRLWHSDSMMQQNLYGKFRVKYPDGQISVKFSYKTAKDYKEIFGGEIIELF
jgi:hypothetical protein